jgi:hypothetical protein
MKQRRDEMARTQAEAERGLTDTRSKRTELEAEEAALRSRVTELLRGLKVVGEEESQQV